MINHDCAWKLCLETNDEDEIKTSKYLLFSLLHNDADTTNFIKRRHSKICESKAETNLKDILQLLTEKGTTEFPQFVALDLGNLPPITFDHIDVTALLTQIEKV